MKNSKVPVLVISCVAILLCCLIAAILVAAWLISRPASPEMSALNLTPEQIPPTEEVVIRPEESPIQMRSDTLQILENTEVPISDLIDLAIRYDGKTNIPTALDPVPVALQVGAQDQFWASDTDSNENFSIDATLKYVTDHAYFWIQDGIRYREDDLRELAETFENEIYPTNRAYFGSEWSPGVDGDPHLYIIYTAGLGRSNAGYFAPSDEYHHLAHEYSNVHETFMLNADNLSLDRAYTFGVLAHEFQHMIHWYQDRNETSWVNEGLSELASYLNGYDIGGFDILYTVDPDIQLNDWPAELGETAPHYGASFLFFAYFLDRIGVKGVQSLASHPENGLAGIDAVLEDIGWVDPVLGVEVRATDLFLDWTLATYLNDRRISDGRYQYRDYDRLIPTQDTEVIDSCPTEAQTRNVHQYGVDYIRIDCRGNYVLEFMGTREVNLLPVNPHSGEHAYWSNRGDDSNMTLTKTFDFRKHLGPITLEYWTWFDLEEDYDYVYLAVSKDGGNWQIINTPAGTAQNISGHNYGWGYNGLSGGNGRWIKESVDLSEFAGEQVEVRFDYVTDGAVNGEGFLLDDINIPEIGYFSDFETEGDGWEAGGFVKIQNTLPQTFRLALIEDGDTIQVKYIQLDASNGIDIPLNFDGQLRQVVLVVTGTTRFTRQVATYQFQIASAQP